jgi:hypothetical protein
VLLGQQASPVFLGQRVLAMLPPAALLVARLG